MKPQSRLFLIDAHALCYRSFYAIRDLKNSKGQATNAVYGFVNTIRKILRDYHPEYLAVCFDSPEKTRRQEKFSEYKIQRPAMPDSLIDQMGMIKEAVKAYNLTSLEIGGFEADDIMATLASHYASPELPVVIVSDDKDMYQLVNKNVQILSSKNEQIQGYEDIKSLLGFEPPKIVDYIGLAGDSVDNIPGIHGIGKVTALNLIVKYGSIENIYKKLEEVSPAKVKEKIESGKDIAVMSKDLALLDVNVPLNMDLEKLRVKPPDSAKLFEIFKNLEFHKLAAEFESKFEGNANQQNAVTIESQDDLIALMKSIEKEGCFAFLLDVMEDQNGKRDVLGIVISLKSAGTYYVPAFYFDALGGVFKNPQIEKVTYNLKKGLKLLFKQNISLEGKVFDVLLGGFLLSQASSTVLFSDLVWSYLKKNLSASHPISEEARYLQEVSEKMFSELKEKELNNLLEDIETPLSFVLARMEEEGVTIDTKLLEVLSADCEKKINALMKSVHQMAGEEFNLNSPKQLAHVLFEKLKLPVVKKTKTGFSTDEGVLNKLAVNHPFPALILEYRQLAKLKSTYIDALPTMINEETGRVHAEFNQIGTETGRLSSRHPNLQNIPIRTPLGQEIRKAFIASQKDHILISADYSQIELRILAHLSKDQNLIQAFQSNQDIHRYTASLVYDIKEEHVTDAMRDLAKRVNFGIIYGMSAFGLSKDLNISQVEAQVFIDRYFMRYPQVKDFMDGCIVSCAEKGYVTTLFNRRRYIPDIQNQNINLKQFAERQAINTPVQGSAADLMKLTMIQMQNEMDRQKLDSKMIITVHDELVFDVPRDEEKKMVKTIYEIMEHPVELIVPIKVSIKVGENWLNMKDV